MATLEREAQAVLDGMAAGRAPPPEHPPSDEAWAAAIRDTTLRMGAMSGEPGPAECVRHQIEGNDGPLDLRVYRSEPGILPALVFFHGGAFVGGSLDTHDAALRSLAAATSAVVVAVDYRRAPEHPFPAAPEDCYATAAYVAANADRFGADPARIVVAGDSAGGNLAAAVTLMARDRNGPNLAGQVCIYPAVDLRPERAYPSITEWDGILVSKADADRDYAMYLAGADAAHPYASPLLAADRHGLPPALVITCECDRVRDEGAEYARRLQEAGVPVQHVPLAGMIHGIFQMGGVIGATRTMMADIGRWLAGLSAATPGPDRR